MILLIDNYDSFVHNLARYVQRLGPKTLVARNDALSIADIRRLRPEAIVISPGPCTPDEAGISLEVVRQLTGEYPILGVCLGHQAIAQALGGKVIRAPEPMHGRTSEIFHRSERLFAGLPSPMLACRYHSLVADWETLAAELEVTATTADDVVMAIEHRNHPTFGVQFHPESILTRGGLRLIANFLAIANIPFDEATAATDELPLLPVVTYVPPVRPVTF